MSTRFQGTVTDATPGTRYSASLGLTQRAWAGWLRPLVLLAMRQDQRHLHRIRQALEVTTVTPAQRHGSELRGSVERISRTAQPAPLKDGVDLARG